MRSSSTASSTSTREPSSRSSSYTGGRNPGAEGGGIRASESLTIGRSRVVANRNLGSGAGISISDGLLSVIRSAVSNNQSTDAAGFTGGGIQAVNDADLLIRSSRVVGNGSTGDGGALYLGAESVRVIDSTIARNSAAFGGGGMHTSASSPVVIRDSTIAGNRSADGGGIEAFSPVVITNSTLDGNRASEDGGGVWAGGLFGEVSMNAVTVARNVADANGDDVGTGGGIYYASVAPDFEVENSLIARNRLGNGTPNDCYADPANPFDSLGHNLLSTLDPGDSCLGFDGPGDRVRANPRIGPLARNGGPTMTIALKRRSPAIGEAKRATAPKRDQRGVRRDRRPDIGAFELER